MVVTMFDEIRFSQHFYYEDEIINSVFQVNTYKHEAKFIEYEYPYDGEFDENNPKFKKAIEFKEQTSDNVNKTFDLSPYTISLIKQEIDKVKFTDFKSHGYRVNPHIHYNIEFLKNSGMGKFININLKYRNELIALNNSLKSIFKFPIYDISFLDTVITEHDYEIRRDGIYLKDTSEKVDLGNINFNINGELFDFVIDWTVDFNEKIFEFQEEIYDLNDNYIETIHSLIEIYGVYNWFYPEYYEKINEKAELCPDGSSWELTFDFENDKKLILTESEGYPDTYPQLAFKIIEIFGLDLLKSEYPDNLDLYYRYGDSKIKNVGNIIPLENSK